jgi:SNF2 family DNA or RNA helicase
MLWRSLFSSTTLSEGRKNFNEGKVKRIQKITDESYQAKVQENYTHTVHINFIDEKRLKMTCDCQCEPYCKHQAAALYKIEEIYGIDNIVKQISEKMKKTIFFPRPETYQYFNLNKITAQEEIDRKKYEKAVELVKRGDVLLSDVEVEYMSSEEGLLVSLVGCYKPKNSRTEKTIIIEMDDNEILSKSCDVNGCQTSYFFYYYRNDNPICVHQVALLILFEEFQKTHAVGDSTDMGAEIFMSRYRMKRINTQPEGEITAEKFHLEPKLEKAGDTLKLRFRVGTDKMYAVKNLTMFIDDVESGGIMKLGTKNELNFAVSTVADDAKGALDFIKRIIRDVERFEENRRIPNYVTPYEVKDAIELYGNRIDDFFELYNGRKIIYEDKQLDIKNSSIILRDKSPKCNLTVMKNVVGTEFQGVTVSGRFPTCIEGNKASYYISEDKIKGNYLNRFSSEQMELLQPLADVERDGNISFKVGRNHLAEFFYKVVPELSQAVEIKQLDTDIIEQYLPPEARFFFYLDAENGNITCEVEARYGDEILKTKELITNENQSVFRDYEQELRVVGEVMQIFPKVSDDKTMLHCGNDEDAIYYVLKNGIDRLMALGIVNSTDSFKRLTLKTRLKVKVGVSVESDIMNLDISSDDLSREELVAILNSYKKKKKYHRLKNGDFVNLDDETIASLEDMFDNLRISPKDFVRGKMKIPSYRALYLDKMLENTVNLYADRDKNFKKLIKEFKTVDESDFEVPESLQDVMRNYQVHGYKWMRTIAAYGFGGILADDMGLGKTLQMISVLLASKLEGNNGCSIVICPASLVYNWQEEFRRFAPDINTSVIAGTQAERQSLLKEYENHDVLITSYDLLKRDIDLYEGINFNFEVIDEAQYIKTHTTAASKAVKLINSSKRFALTGTPIENRLSELWSIFDYLMPGYLYEYDTFKREIENQVVKYKDESATTRLKRMVSPFILRRLKGDVLKDLPAKLEEIRYAKLEGEQQRIYDGQVVNMKNMIENQDEADFQKNKIKILAELTKIRQICCNPSLLFEDYKGESAKTQACLDLIESAHEGGHKMLVFSQFKSMLSILERELDDRKIEYYKITGETKKDKRIELVNQFNQDDTPVFLISLKAGGTGLNLTGADIVIHYDPWWNVAVQNQATDRAHRIGQTKTVSVYKLIVKNSIEEKIVKMQEEKKNLADEILSGDMGSIGQMSKEDLLELIG